MSLRDTFTIARLEARLVELATLETGQVEYVSGLLYGSFIAYVTAKHSGYSMLHAIFTGVVSVAAGRAIPSLAIIAPAAYVGCLQV